MECTGVFDALGEPGPGVKGKRGWNEVVMASDQEETSVPWSLTLSA